MENRTPYDGRNLDSLRTTRTVKESTRKSMQGNHSKDTRPELILRRALWAAGVRGYRCHPKGVPGTPDIWFPRAKVAVFVQGCFWHGHGCPKSSRPRTNAEFWAEKVIRNQARDAWQHEELRSRGVCVLTVWECCLKAELPFITGLVLDIAAKKRT